MKVYNKKADKVETVEDIIINNIRYKAKNTSKENLFLAGFCKIEYTLVPDRRYYNITPANEIIDKTYQIKFKTKEKDIADVKERMIEDLQRIARDKFEANTRKYHSAEMSHFTRLARQARDYIEQGEVSPLIQNECDITGQSVDEFVSIILIKSDVLDAQKAYISGTRKVKEIEIEALIDIDACILYEATPHTEDVEDVETGEMVETTLYRNNITHWTKPYQE